MASLDGDTVLAIGESAGTITEDLMRGSSDDEATAEAVSRGSATS